MPVEERYAVTKVRTIEGMLFRISTQIVKPLILGGLGFYGVTYYIGFRDDFDVKVSDQNAMRRNSG